MRQGISIQYAEICRNRELFFLVLSGRSVRVFTNFQWCKLLPLRPYTSILQAIHRPYVCIKLWPLVARMGFSFSAVHMRAYWQGGGIIIYPQGWHCTYATYSPVITPAKVGTSVLLTCIHSSCWHLTLTSMYKLYSSYILLQDAYCNISPFAVNKEGSLICYLP
jgi:hypothetical protein